MKIDNIKQYLDLRESLVREKAQLEQRLQQINEALGAPQMAQAEVATETPAVETQRGGGGRARRGRPTGGGMSLREAVLRVTAGRAMTKQEILDEVRKLGYRFSTNNPANSLGVILYGKNPRFKNEGGRFSPMGGAASAASSNGGAGSAGAFSRRKRQLSPEARERIAAAQRERWAKARGGK